MASPTSGVLHRPELPSRGAESTEPVLVDFTATCGAPANHCRRSSMRSREELAGKVRVGKLASTDLLDRVKLGIAAFPTLMVFKNGERAAPLVGLTTKSKIPSPSSRLNGSKPPLLCRTAASPEKPGRSPSGNRRTGASPRPCARRDVDQARGRRKRCTRRCSLGATLFRRPGWAFFSLRGGCSCFRQCNCGRLFREERPWQWKTLLLESAVDGCTGRVSARPRVLFPLFVVGGARALRGGRPVGGVHLFRRGGIPRAMPLSALLFRDLRLDVAEVVDPRSLPRRPRSGPLAGVRRIPHRQQIKRICPRCIRHQERGLTWSSRVNRPSSRNLVAVTGDLVTTGGAITQRRRRAGGSSGQTSWFGCSASRPMDPDHSPSYRSARSAACSATPGKACVAAVAERLIAGIDDRMPAGPISS